MYRNAMNDLIKWKNKKNKKQNRLYSYRNNSSNFYSLYNS